MDPLSQCCHNVACSARGLVEHACALLWYRRVGHLAGANCRPSRRSGTGRTARTGRHGERTGHPAPRGALLSRLGRPPAPLTKPCGGRMLETPSTTVSTACGARQRQG
jgi:hypothetical protein